METLLFLLAAEVADVNLLGAASGRLVSARPAGHNESLAVVARPLLMLRAKK